MAQRRRLLPSMSALAAFEAAARTGSFTAAAHELHLTQGAVSRQIKALEDLLGRPLFVRQGQRVALTADGEGYAAQVREALQQIGSATLRVMTAQRGGVLKLAILPTFGTRWLVPRLPAFLDGNPQVMIHFTTKLEPFDFSREDLDAAIHFGDPDWPGAVCDRLMDEEVLPVCSPAFAAEHRIDAVADLAGVALIHTTSRPDAWPEYLAAHGLDRHEGAAMYLEQFSIAAQAAMAGLGVALLPTFLIRSELERGELVPAVDAPYRSARAYYLVHPVDRTDYPPLVAFRRWLLDQTALNVKHS